MRRVQLLTAFGHEDQLYRDVFAVGRGLPGNALFEHLDAGGLQQQRKVVLQTDVRRAHRTELELTGELEAVFGIVRLDFHDRDYGDGSV
ncbi:hypothetical protein D9M71_759150 [compost metagenome]